MTKYKYACPEHPHISWEISERVQKAFEEKGLYFFHQGGHNILFPIGLNEEEPLRGLAEMFGAHFMKAELVDVREKS